MNLMEGVQTQCSANTTAICYVKSKYLNNWGLRELYINVSERKLYMRCMDSGKIKSYPIDKIQYTRNKEINCIYLNFSNNRTYQIKNNNNLEFLLSEIEYYNKNSNFQVKYFQELQLQNKMEELGCLESAFRNICRQFNCNMQSKRQNVQLNMFVQQPIPIPKKTNYFHASNKYQSINEKSFNLHEFIKIQRLPLQRIENCQTKQRNFQDYERVNEYIKSSDWIRDVKNGCLVFINQSKKNMIPQLISYSAKKALSSGDISNINFPTFAMKPQSSLQTYCKCLGAAPLILNNIQKDPIERIKAFNVIILTLSIQLNDIEKSFNPLLGQTFQGQIAGYPIYAQQISSNPHISYFLFIGKNYKLFGSLQLKTNVGLNEAIGIFEGEITLQFNDGGIVKGIMPKGIMSGVLFGKTKFGPIGAVYSYDPLNKYICSYETKKGDLMTGQIGKLKQLPYNKFQEFLVTKISQKFKHIPQKQYELINERVQVFWSHSIQYGGKMYFDYTEKKNFPIKITQKLQRIRSKLLSSDSSYRKDIKLRKENNIQQSQKQNDRLEKQQQRTKKLKKIKKN